MQNKNRAFFKDFLYPKAEKIPFPLLVLRRLHQMGQILFSPRYQSSESMSDGTIKHYSLPEETQFYDKYTEFGLHQNEKEALDWALNKISKHNPKILVVGCGAGREALAIKKKIPKAKILGIDFSKAMISKACKHQQKGLCFLHTSVDCLQDRYDLIWVTAILESHIQGQKNRIAFYSALKKLTHKQTRIVLTPQIKPLHWRSPNYWSSQFLRMRWHKTKQWEQGDVVLANLGAHHKVKNLVFSHFYPSPLHLDREIEEALLKTEIVLPQESWILMNGIDQPIGS